MLIATVTTYLLISGVQHSTSLGSNKQTEVPGYKVAYVPGFLRGTKPNSRIDDSSVIRGYNPIISHWVIKKPFGKTARDAISELSTDGKLTTLTNKRIESLGHLSLRKNLSDRSLKFSISAGRYTVKKSGQTTVHSKTDLETYTSIQVQESPLPFGPKPNAWPRSAQKIQPLPIGFPRLPFKGIHEMPASWHTSEVPSGATQYWVKWYVKEDAAKLVPRLINELRMSQSWNATSELKEDRGRFTPVNKRSGYVWLHLGPVGKGTTVISISWVDLSSGLFNRLKVGNPKVKLKG